VLFVGIKMQWKPGKFFAFSFLILCCDNDEYWH
jgi:hypothetical protein